MQLTDRDIRLIRDIALSTVMARDQVIGLEYYGSVTRANTRLRYLCAEHFLRRLDTPFFGQNLYAAGRRSAGIVGDRIADIIHRRTRTPRFIQHALAVTNTRMMLIRNGATHWRFEPQIRTPFHYAGREYILKPDGLSNGPAGLVAVEADLGHVSPAKFREKLRAYEAFVLSGACREHWDADSFSLLVVTTGHLRAGHLAQLHDEHAPFDLMCRAHTDLGVKFAGGWS